MYHNGDLLSQVLPAKWHTTPITFAPDVILLLHTVNNWRKVSLSPGCATLQKEKCVIYLVTKAQHPLLYPINTKLTGTLRCWHSTDEKLIKIQSESSLRLKERERERERDMNEAGWWKNLWKHNWKALFLRTAQEALEAAIQTQSFVTWLTTLTIRRGLAGTGGGG